MFENFILLNTELIIIFDLIWLDRYRNPIRGNDRIEGYHSGRFISDFTT